MTLLLVHAALAFLVFSLTWLLARSIKNAGVVDIAWSGFFSLVALLYGIAGAGDTTRKMVLGTLVLVWSLRLKWYLLLRFLLDPSKEDTRYHKLRESWGKDFDRKSFVFFQFQALSTVLLSAPFWFAFQNSSGEFAALEAVGFGFWALGITGETLADVQMWRFKTNPRHRGKVLNSGLWRYSRHPNYFFEWLVWVGFGLISLAAPYGWLGLSAPIIMWYLLVRVTGVASSETLTDASRTEAYREYQRTTSTFVPWFPKR